MMKSCRCSALSSSHQSGVSRYCQSQCELLESISDTASKSWLEIDDRRAGTRCPSTNLGVVHGGPTSRMSPPSMSQVTRHPLEVS